MITRHVLTLSTAVALSAMAAGMASSQTSQPTLQARTAASTFLSPLPGPLIFTPTDWKFCGERQRRQCPPVLTYGAAAGPALPTIEPVIKSYLPHVRVTFWLQEKSNTVVANDGVVPDDDTLVGWTTTGAAATEEHSGPFFDSLPPPGETWPVNPAYHPIIYDALVLNACDNFPPFPVEHDAVIEDGGSELGASHRSDNSTIDHTGYYNFSYKVRATGPNGNVSDFTFSGKVNVLCTGLNSLP